MTVELRLDEVSFRYGRKPDTLHALQLQQGAGILGLLGPNGAGKSTLMRLLATLSAPSRGRITWNGGDIARDPNALRRELGYLPQELGVYPALSAREFLAYLAAVKGLDRRRGDERIDACLAAVGLAHAADRRLGDFSGGMRQRVGIAQALLNEPRLLIVDEPTVGLDPEERLRFRQILTELAADRLVILSTHIVSDVDSSADRIAVMRSGRLLAHVTPGELIARAVGQVWRCTIGDSELPALRERHPVSHVERADGGLRVHVIARAAPQPAAEAIAPALEDAYLACLHLADAA
jgi:ABC-2 type transport system ATP-binding protein